MTQNVPYMPRSERMVIKYVLKAAADAGKTQRAVLVEHQDAQSKISKSEKDPFSVSNPWNQEMFMMVTPPVKVSSS